MSLRGRLLTGLVALVTIGMVVSSVVTYTALRSFLVDRIDQQRDELRAQRQPPHGRRRAHAVGALGGRST